MEHTVHMGVYCGGKKEPDGVRGVGELLADGAPLPGHRRILSNTQLLHIEILLLMALGWAVPYPGHRRLLSYAQILHLEIIILMAAFRIRDILVRKA